MKEIITDSYIDNHLERGWKRISNYTGARVNMDFECPSKHTVNMRWEHYKKGTRCKYCNGVAKLSNSEIDKRLEPGWQRRSDYINSQTHLTLVCPKGHTVKIKWANYQQGKRCGYCFKENNRGENHHSWIKWLTDEIRERRARKTTEYKEWRLGVYKRDKYTCQVCGSKSKNLNAHHLEGFSTNKELRYEIKNGVTLCENCHKKFHKRYGNNNNSRKQFEEYIKCKTDQLS